MPPSPAPCAPVVVALRGAPAARHRRRPPPVAYVAVVSIGHQIRWVRILQMCPPSIPIRWIRISYHPCGPILDTYHYTYTSWPPRNTFFWPAFVTRILTPRTRKSGYGLLLGCRSPLDAGPFVKTFLDDARTPKPGKSSPSDVYFGPASQSIKRGRISREGALDLRESRERRDRIFAGKTENAKILDQKQQISMPMGNFHFFGRGQGCILHGGRPV